MKTLLAFCLVIFSTFAFAELKIEHGVQIYYSEAIDVFEISDNLVLGEYKENDYHRYWASNLGLESSEKSLLSKYNKLREKYYPDFLQKNEMPEMGNSLFSPSSMNTPDRFAQTFYTSESVDEALKKLATNALKD